MAPTRLSTHSQEFKAGIAVAALTDWRYYDSAWAEAFMKRPQENAAGYDKTSLLRSAKNLHGRLLLVHGTYDDNVHPQNAWNFIDELLKPGKMFDLMIYPMRKYGISDDPPEFIFTTAWSNSGSGIWNQTGKYNLPDMHTVTAQAYRPGPERGVSVRSHWPM